VCSVVVLLKGGASGARVLKTANGDGVCSCGAAIVLIGLDGRAWRDEPWSEHADNDAGGLNVHAASGSSWRFNAILIVI